MRVKSPKQLALVISGIISVIAIAIFSIQLFVEIQLIWLYLIFVFLLLFSISYIVISTLCNTFVVTKINPLFNAIREIAYPQEQLAERISSSSGFTAINDELVEWVRRTEKEMQELKDTEKFRKEFLSNVAHELKTPIFNVQGYILTLIDSDLKDEYINKKYLKRADKNINRLISTIQDIDTISRLESGELRLDMEVFNLSKLVEEVFEMYEMTAAEYKITLQYTYGFDKSIFVNADKKRIFEVLNNLIINSIKYGKPNGKTVVTTREENNKIFVEITDNGIGIEQKNIPLIFKRFYRVDKSRSRERGGTGLGLAIVKHILEAHNQNIHVVSELNVGSSFVFALEKATF